MKQLVRALCLLVVGYTRISAQTFDNGRIQFHGFATQALIYSNHNNWNTTESSHVSLAWTEAVLNLSYQPTAKLRIGIQPRYFLLGTYGHDVKLDWVQADYNVNEYFGVRGGQVKTPAGLLNETQDIDPSYVWILLPSVYPIASRSSVLSHQGGVVYGKVQFGSHGALAYHAFGGRRAVASDDGFLQTFRDNGLLLPHGFAGPIYGGTLDWSVPAKGLLVGVSRIFARNSGAISAGSLQGTVKNGPITLPIYFARYERRRLMVAGEYDQIMLHSLIAFQGGPNTDTPLDERNWYVMATYKPLPKLTAGTYYGNSIELKMPQSMYRYQKDWTFTGRYDVNSYLYMKVEQHVMDGLLFGFSPSNNPGGLRPNTRMTLAKLGVSF